MASLEPLPVLSPRQSSNSLTSTPRGGQTGLTSPTLASLGSLIPLPGSARSSVSSNALAPLDKAAGPIPLSKGGKQDSGSSLGSGLGLSASPGLHTSNASVGSMSPGSTNSSFSMKSPRGPVNSVLPKLDLTKSPSGNIDTSVFDRDDYFTAKASWGRSASFKQSNSPNEGNAQDAQSKKSPRAPLPTVERQGSFNLSALDQSRPVGIARAPSDLKAAAATDISLLSKSPLKPAFVAPSRDTEFTKQLLSPRSAQQLQ